MTDYRLIKITNKIKRNWNKVLWEKLFCRKITVFEKSPFEYKFYGINIPVKIKQTICTKNLNNLRIKQETSKTKNNKTKKRKIKVKEV